MTFLSFGALIGTQFASFVITRRKATRDLLLFVGTDILVWDRHSCVARTFLRRTDILMWDGHSCPSAERSSAVSRRDTFQ